MEVVSRVQEWLAANWFAALGIPIAVAIGYYFYWLSKREKRPVFASRNVVIVQNAKQTFPSLQVHYRGYGNDLDNLSATIIAVWNAGNETIHSSDITSAKPLAIKAAADGVKLLGASVIQLNNPASRAACTFTKNSNEALLTFEYLDPGNGMVVEVLHTGTSQGALRVEGTFKGCGDIRNHARNPSGVFPRRLLLGKEPHKLRNVAWRLAVLGVCMNIFIVVAFTYHAFSLAVKPAFPVVTLDGRQHIATTEGYDVVEESGSLLAYPHQKWVSIAVYAVLVLVSAVNLRQQWILLRQGVPRGLEQFDERHSQ
jgi:hypothetical protein